MPSDILIVPNRNSTTINPNIQFSGSAVNTIRLEAQPSGSVAFVGNSGSLFSIVDSMSGSLMAVSDVSGLPILEVFSDDRVVMGKFNSNTLVVTGSRVGVGINNPTYKFEVSGSDITVHGIRIGRGPGGKEASIVIGNGALSSATGDYNVAIGYSALQSTSTGYRNIAIGWSPMAGATVTGYDNIAIGAQALNSMAGGGQTVAIGGFSGYYTTGGNNTLIGHTSGFNLSTGTGNTLIGLSAGINVTSGNYNTVLGGSVDIGNVSNTIAIGDGSGTTRILINSNGNMGLGKTNNINAKLDISGNAIVTGSLNVTGNVGIGSGVTSTQKLDVLGRMKFRSDGTLSAGAWYTDSAGTENVFVGQTGNTSTSAFGVFSNSAWQFAVLNGGNVGIGTSTPSTKLNIYSSTADPIFRITPLGSYDGVIQITGEGDNIATEGLEIWYKNDTGDAHISTTYPSDVAAIRFHTRVGASKSTSNERFTIYGDGNIGINKASPAAKLDVNGSSLFSGTFTISGYDATINSITVGLGNSNVSLNTAVGYEALKSITNGSWSVGVGYRAIRNVTTGVANTAIGYLAMSGSVESSGSNYSTAVGWRALSSVKAGYHNTAVGSSAGISVENGYYNTFLGSGAGTQCRHGYANTAIGVSALSYILENFGNVAIGWTAGAYLTQSISNTGGLYNTFVGVSTGPSSYGLEGSGSNNTCVGYGAGNSIRNGGANVIIGGANGTANMEGTIILSDGGGNIRLAADQSGNVCIGGRISNINARLDVSGSAIVSGSLTVGTGIAVSTTNGEIRAKDNITAYYSSDERLKTNIVKIDNPLDKIKQIDGVLFDWNDTYKKQYGEEDGYFIRKQNSGIIAQQVEKVFPNVVADRENGYKAVRYELLVPLLIEAIKEQQVQIDELKNKLK